ncbi:MAG TPA: ABC transporter permease, partial [Pirellulales bacterium]|nr:ABC transporter permease [Pirellulales bacterium]
MNVLWLQAWKLGVKNLALHPLRSLLTVVGVFIGVASVIWLLAIGNGISAAVQKQIEGLGADNIIVRSIKPPNESLTGRGDGPVPYGLTRDDFARLQETIPTIERALPVRELRREFRSAERLVDGRLVGCTPEYAEVTRLKLVQGRFLGDADWRDRAN